ncbi:sigma-70 family RNA polymerase sigma factor [Lentisphaera profundi]|uniref:Sigma-70 family RNA polymerase sigma factor n=1 Tax=Lentisphaera profundi TaxID=1658616 RepID=A0ABY7VYW8_9BACT|nr:sigma-70 family RNA polymerase sigma factor [Lentisphaera profundi]WDE98974.1 sigma-70 family RNA polymerase sigma factor [Lentisphaera profundi]
MAFTTQHTVIEKLRAGEGIAWEEFAKTYRKLVYLRGKDRGLFDHESSDLFQEVMLSLYRGETLFKFDKSKGRFRDYLKKIIDRRAFDILRKRKNKECTLIPFATGGVVLESTDLESSEQHWMDEWHRHLLDQALSKVKSQVTEVTYEAFVMLFIDQIDANRVADSLGLSIESVYVAKHRILKRLRPIVNSLMGDEK